MILKLSKIFIPLPDMEIYLARELYALKLHPDFIKKMARKFQLTYVDNNGVESNLCFAENQEVRSEYRTTFSKKDIVNNIFLQLTGETVNIAKDEVVFENDFFC